MIILIGRLLLPFRLIILITIFGIGLFGCATAKWAGSDDLSNSFDTFINGEARLACGAPCSGAWGWNMQNFKILHENAQWRELATEVLRVGHKVELAYYYLGRSAEGLGHVNSARIYYNLALDENKKLACAGFFNVCNGIDLPRATRSRMDGLAKAYTYKDLTGGSNAAQETPTRTTDGVLVSRNGVIHPTGGLLWNGLARAIMKPSGQLQVHQNKVNVLSENGDVLFSFDNGRFWVSSAEFSNDGRSVIVQSVSSGGRTSFSLPGMQVYSKASSPKFSTILADKINKLSDVYQQLPEPLWVEKKEVDNPPKPPQRLTKDEFETTASFRVRVAKAQSDYDDAVALYNSRVSNYERQVKDHYANIGPLPEELRNQAIREAFLDAYGKPLISNVRYDADTHSFYAEITAEGSNDLRKTVVVRDIHPSQARNLKQELEKASPEVTFRILPDNSLEWETITLQAGSQRLVAMPVRVSGEPPRLEVAIKPAEVATPKIDIPTRISTQKIEVAIRDDPVIAAKQAEIDRIRRDQARNTAREAELKRLEEEMTRLKSASPANFTDNLPDLIARVTKTPTNPRLHLLAVGIEDYADVADVPFASRSASRFVEVAKRVFGVPEQNALLLTNGEATGTRIKGRLNSLLNRLGPQDALLIYYAGHGVPDPEGKYAYLLPQDAAPGSFEDSQLRLDAFYRKLADSKAGRVTVFMDACFTGRADEKRMVFEGVAPVMLIPTTLLPDNSRLTVFTATGKQQFANQDKEHGHRLFSYHLMRALLDGRTDVPDLARYVGEQVQVDSRRLGPEFEQKPELLGRATGRLVDK